MAANLFQGVDTSSKVALICISERDKGTFSNVIDEEKTRFAQLNIFCVGELHSAKEIYDHAIVVCYSDSLFPSCLNTAFLCLKPNGKLSFYTQGVHESFVVKNMLLSGFLEVTDGGRTKDGSDLFCSRKPNFGIDHIRPINLPKPSKNWDLEDDALIDEDTLLNEEDKKRPPVEALKTELFQAECSDLAGGQSKRRPCKNCTCGLAKHLEADELKDGPVRSGCGNCGLGDAFRCSTCPFLGMPPFKTDEGGRVQLSSVMDL